MRVRGNDSPEILSIEPYPPMEGYVEVRARENISKIEMVDEQTEIPISMFEYDEYTFILKNREDLRENIEKNLSDWLITGRMLEVNEYASVVQDMRTALKILEVNE